MCHMQRTIQTGTAQNKQHCKAKGATKLPQQGGVEITPFEGGDMRCCRLEDLSTLTTDAASQLDVLGHDSNTLGVDGSQVGVLE